MGYGSGGRGWGSCGLEGRVVRWGMERILREERNGR